MSASIRIYNDGPNAVDVMIGGKYRLNLPCGAGTVLVTSGVLSFQPVREMTPVEYKMHMGVDMPVQQPVGRFAEDEN